MSPLRCTLALLSSMLLFATTLVTTAASASEGDSHRGTGIVDEAQRWLSAAAAGPVVASEPTMPGLTAPVETDVGSALSLAKEKPFVDFASPQLSLVARDWHGSMKLAGNRTLLVDDLRPTASNRLVVARVATDARLSTFVQVGVGEWRIDPVMFPNARSYSEIAGQISAGFELRIPAGLRVAGEAQYTALYHDLHYTSDEVAPRIAAFVVAIDGRF